jgi:hypothetical protein
MLPSMWKTGYCYFAFGSKMMLFCMKITFLLSAEQGTSGCFLDVFLRFKGRKSAKSRRSGQLQSMLRRLEIGRYGCGVLSYEKSILFGIWN